MIATLPKSFLEDIDSFDKNLQALLIEAYEQKSLHEEQLLVTLEEGDTTKQYDQILELCKEWELAFVSVEEAIQQHVSKDQVKLGEIRFYHKDFVQLLFRDISSIQLLTFEEEKEFAYRIKK